MKTPRHISLLSIFTTDRLTHAASTADLTMSKTFNLLHLLQAPPVQPNPERLVPFHILIADHLKPAMTPLLHPIGHISFDLLAGFNAFNNHLIKQLGAAPVFDLFPARTGQLDEAQLKEVKCVAFKPEVVREGVRGNEQSDGSFCALLASQGVYCNQVL